MPRKSAKKGHGIDVNRGSMKILRTLGEQEAFHFYSSLGHPTGETARSLPEFLEKIRSAQMESLKFHLERKDFQNWVKTTLGDSKLARQIGKIRHSKDDLLRMKMCATIENRIRYLVKTQSQFCISEDLVVNPPNAMH